MGRQGDGEWEVDMEFEIGEGDMRRQGDGEMRTQGDKKTGRWGVGSGDGKMRRYGHREIGRQGDGEWDHPNLNH